MIRHPAKGDKALVDRSLSNRLSWLIAGKYAVMHVYKVIIYDNGYLLELQGSPYVNHPYPPEKRAIILASIPSDKPEALNDDDLWSGSDQIFIEWNEAAQAWSIYAPPK